MDIGLPDISGYEVSQKMRRIEKNDNPLPIIALSAHTDLEYNEKCVEAGMNGVLNKPLLRKTALEMLHAFIPHRFVRKEKKSKKIIDEKTEDILTLTDKIFDPDYLRSELDYPEVRIKKMPKLLFESLPPDVEHFKVAYQENDLILLQDMAHKMKSAALYGGALRLKEACYRLEKYLHDGKRKLISDLYQLVLREVKAFNDLMKKT